MPRSRSPFRPGYGNRLVSFADYEGRVGAVRQQLGRAEEVGSPFVNVTGHTASGKSCALLLLGLETRAEGWAVDLKFIASVGERAKGGIAGSVVQQVADALLSGIDTEREHPAARHGEVLAWAERNRWRDLTAATAVRELRRACELLGGHGTGVLVVLDEAQGLQPVKLSKFAQVTQKLFDEGLPIRVVCCGIPPYVQEVLPSVTVAQLRDAPTVIVRSLLPHQTRECVVATAAAADGSFTDGALDFIVRESHGAAYWMQLLGKYAWEFADHVGVGRKGGMRVTLRHTKKAYNYATARYEEATSYPLWAYDLREIDREVIATVEVSEVRDEQAAVAATSARTGLAEEECRAALRDNIDLGVLSQPEGKLVLEGPVRLQSIGWCPDSMEGEEWAAAKRAFERRQSDAALRLPWPSDAERAGGPLWMMQDPGHLSWRLG